MNEEIEKKLDSIIRLLDNDSRIKELVNKKNTVLNKENILKKIEELKELDIYSDEYRLLKKELFEDIDFVSFKQLETEINYLILEINSKLKELTNERRCSS